MVARGRPQPSACAAIYTCVRCPFKTILRWLGRDRVAAVARVMLSCCREGGVMQNRAITYHNEGIELAATLYLPDHVEPGQKLPTLVLLTGYNAHQKVALPDVASYFTPLGYAALALDYRGRGLSGGRRGHVNCDERVRDTRAAITWLEAQSEVDPDRIGIYGSSFGGSIAAAVAALDRRVRAIACIGSPTDGESWMAGTRTWAEWLTFRARVQEDARRRSMGEEGEVVNTRDEFMPWTGDPQGADFTARRRAVEPGHIATTTLESAESTIDFKPIEMVHRISPRAILIIHGDSDPRVPVRQAIDMFRRAGEPKRLCILRKASHFDVTNPGPRFQETLKLAEEWFEQHLKAVPDLYAPTPYL
jgi:uncharacterized protein